MARIWQEGFENGFPHADYLEGTPYSQHIRGLSIPYFPSAYKLVTGRSVYSQYSLQIKPPVNNGMQLAVKTILEVSEVYFRVWIKNSASGNPLPSTLNEILALFAGSNPIISLVEDGTSTTAFKFYVRIGGSYTSVASVTIPLDTWTKIEFYIKINSTLGSYEIRIDDVAITSASDVNTGSTPLNSVRFGANAATGSFQTPLYISFDDLALNDTSGTINNFWCGAGTIVGLKPKGTGGKSQFTTSQGWVLGESGTTTTNIKITGHGLSTNDVIYNVTRDVYRIVTKVDNDNLTVSSVTSQTEADVFKSFIYQSTITAASGTDTNHVVVSGHTLESYDVFVNTSRSNAIRRVIYVNGTSLYNYASLNGNVFGSQVTSQTSGDSIKTFKVKQYPIGEHYRTCNQASPNPQFANIQSSVSGHQDTFDMEELVADKSIPSNAGIIAVSHNIYAKEKGAGSQIKPVLRIGGVYYAGTAVPLIGGTLQYQTMYDLNPEDTAQWSITDIDSLEAGVEVV
jgi:hypothetical protein